MTTIVLELLKNKFNSWSYSLNIVAVQKLLSISNIMLPFLVLLGTKAFFYAAHKPLCWLLLNLWLLQNCALVQCFLVGMCIWVMDELEAWVCVHNELCRHISTYYQLAQEAQESHMAQDSWRSITATVLEQNLQFCFCFHAYILRDICSQSRMHQLWV